VKVIEYFSAEHKEYWLSKIKASDWDAGQYLHRLLKEQMLGELVGPRAEVLLLVDGQELISFCTLADKDDIQPTELGPWVGWMYTFPTHRGHRYAGQLLRHAEELAKADGADTVYISTNHVGLYETYGYEFLRIMKDIDGQDSRVYVKYL
jgi:GNAT superfamily N-acetyltransferase